MGVSKMVFPFSLYSINVQMSIIKQPPTPPNPPSPPTPKETNILSPLLLLQSKGMPKEFKYLHTTPQIIFPTTIWIPSLLFNFYCLYPTFPIWVGYRIPYGSIEFWWKLIKFELCCCCCCCCGGGCKKPELSTRLWVLSPLCTSSSTWHICWNEGTNISLWPLTTSFGFTFPCPAWWIWWAWFWPTGRSSGTELSPAKVAQSILPDPKVWRLIFWSWWRVFREFILGNEKNRSSISGKDSSISSNWEEEDDDEPWLYSLLLTPESCFAAPPEFFL